MKVNACGCFSIFYKTTKITQYCIIQECHCVFNFEFLTYLYAMNFLYPGFLFALSALAVPILIHLFQFRRYKKEFFSNVAFLKELQTVSKSKRRIKHWLVLVCRLLALSFLVFAFARPYRTTDSSGIIRAGDRLISIYIDNSFSMEASTPDGNLLEAAVKKAEEIARAYKPSDRFELLTNEYSPDAQKFLRRDEFLEKLAALKLSPVSRNIPDIIAKQRDILHRNDKGNVLRSYIISDFQPQSSDFTALTEDSLVETTLIPVSSEARENVYPDSVWFESPDLGTGRPLKLNFRIVNRSMTPIPALPVQLFLNNEAKTPVTIDLQPNTDFVGSVEFTVLNPGPQWGRIHIDDKSVRFDDDLYFSFLVNPAVSVYAICEKPDSRLNKIFGNDPYFTFRSVSSGMVDYSLFKSTNCIIINGLRDISSGMNAELVKFVNEGGSILFIPGSPPDLISWNSTLSTLKSGSILAVKNEKFKVAPPDAANPFFSDVFENIPQNIDMPGGSSMLTLKPSPGQDVLLKTISGLPWFTRTSFGKGRVYLLASSLNPSESNLTEHALFVPLMLKPALSSVRTTPLYHIIGSNDPLIVNATDEKDENPYSVQNDKKTSECIPASQQTELGTALYFNSCITEAGSYKIRRGERFVLPVSFNYDRSESISAGPVRSDSLSTVLKSLGFKSIHTIGTEESSLTAAVKAAEDGIQLWYWCIVIALFFILLEVLILRLWP